MTLFSALLFVVLLPTLLDLVITIVGTLCTGIKGKTSCTGRVAKGKLAIIISYNGERNGLLTTLAAMQLLEKNDRELTLAIAFYGSPAEGMWLRQRYDDLLIFQAQTFTEAIQEGCHHFVREEYLGVCLLRSGTIANFGVPSELRKAFGRGCAAVQLRVVRKETKREEELLHQILFCCSHHLRALGRTFFRLSPPFLEEGIAIRTDIVRAISYISDPTAYQWELLRHDCKIGYASGAVLFSPIIEKERKDLVIWKESMRNLLDKIRKGEWKLVEALFAHSVISERLLALFLLVMWAGELKKLAFFLCMLIGMRIIIGAQSEGISLFSPFSLMQLLRSALRVFVADWNNRKEGEWIRTSRGMLD